MTTQTKVKSRSKSSSRKTEQSQECTLPSGSGKTKTSSQPSSQESPSPSTSSNSQELIEKTDVLLDDIDALLDQSAVEKLRKDLEGFDPTEERPLTLGDLMRGGATVSEPEDWWLDGFRSKSDLCIEFMCLGGEGARSVVSQSFPDAFERQCRGKRTFTNSSDAKRAAKRAQSTFGGGKLDTYRCSHCGRFHNGHATKKEDRRVSK